mgnify:CR=1 FL=1
MVIDYCRSDIFDQYRGRLCQRTAQNRNFVLATVLSIVLVMFLAPYVSDALIKWTPADEMIEEKCMEMFMPQISADTLKNDRFKRDFTWGIESGFRLADINNLDWNQLGINIQDILNIIGEIPKECRFRRLKCSIAGVLKNRLLENNNSTIYQELGVKSFPEYAASYIARMILKVVAFLVTFILVWILVRALMAAVDLIGELPILGFFNHLGGAVVGAAAALLIVWLLFLIITLLYNNAIGQSCFEMIEKSSILTFLYDNNILITKLLSF